MVLEAMAYGTPCIAMTKYGVPSEVQGAGVSIKSEWDNLGNFRVSMNELSATIHQWLQPSNMRAKCEEVARHFVKKYTWQKTARKMLQLSETCQLSETGTPDTHENLFPPIFCRAYHPHTGTTTSIAYRLGVNRYEHLEKALAETLIKRHKTAEVELIFKHFKAETPFTDEFDSFENPEHSRGI